VVLPGTPGLQAVRNAFGDEILAADGTLDRARLRAIILSDENARRKLEGILHPLIWERRDQWLEARHIEGEDLVVSEIPLLFETGREDDFDVIVFVDARESERIQRLIQTRELNIEEARRLIGVQIKASVKQSKADYVLQNNGTLEDLNSAARISSPNALRTAWSPGVPGSTTSRDNSSALMMGTPDLAHCAATVDFPEATLPVSAMFSKRQLPPYARPAHGHA